MSDQGPPRARVVRVLPAVSAIGRAFDYLVPQGWELGVGSRVRVPLNGRRVAGWVLQDVEGQPADVELKPLAGTGGMGPPPCVVELAAWAAWRWAGPMVPLLTSGSPDRVVVGLQQPPPRGSARPPRPDDPLVGLATQATMRVGEPTLILVSPTTDQIGVVEATISSVEGPVLVLVPDGGWAARLSKRLEARGHLVASRWEHAAAGWPVVVGTRRAAFAPLPKIGAAVVLDCHDPSYREQRSPQFDATEVVAQRARRDDAPCLLTSAAPALAQMATANVVKGPALQRGWPAIAVIDRRGADPRTSLYSSEMISIARSARGRVVMVLDRRGGARLLACASCGELVRCETCGQALQEVAANLRCERCAVQRPKVCAPCGGLALKVLRFGAAKARDDLEALLGEEVGEVTGASALEAPGNRVLVGTQALLHRVREAEVVAFMDFDQHLLGAHLNASQNALGLLARAARLVGARVRRSGMLVVQTRMPEHEVLVSATKGEPDALYEKEMLLRKELGLPPFGALAEVRGAEAGAFCASSGLESSRLREDRFLVSAPDHRSLCDALARANRAYSARVVVDPPWV
ncbi:MAG: hypothetical protein ACRDVP_09040 [Acidimicrobiales bacterium]